MDKRPTVAVDFDGTVSHYETWEGVAQIGPPIKGSIEALALLQSEGYRVVVFSARAAHRGGVAAISKWLGQHGASFAVDEITHKKQPFAVLFDDRCRRVATNTGDSLRNVVREWIESDKGRVQ